EQGLRFGRYSFLGFRPRAILRFEAGRLSVDEGKGPRALEAPDPFSAVADYLAAYHVAPLDGLPPFAGGAVGFFGYDLVRTVERVPAPNPDDVGTPDMALMVSDALIVFDHLHHQVTIMVNAFVEADRDVEDAYDRAAALIERARGLLGEPVPRPDDDSYRYERRSGFDAGAFVSNMSPGDYEAAVERCKRYIYAGDAFQVVPSQRWSDPGPLDPVSV